jgi:hypothetical protein
MIVIIGAKGNMGRRYSAILKRMGVDTVEFDLEDNLSLPVTADPAWRGVIIATPTDTHYNLCRWCLAWNIPVLTEKPLDKDLCRVAEICGLYDLAKVPLYMVCNWQYAGMGTNYPGDNEIEYRCYNTGNDGYHWDLIQLHYLARPGQLLLDLGYPGFECIIGGEKITREDIDESYKAMMVDFLKACHGMRHQLWDTKDIIKSHEGVRKWLHG